MRRSIAASGGAVVLLGGVAVTAMVLEDPVRDASRTARGTTVGGLAAGGLDAPGLRVLLTGQMSPTSVTVRLGAAKVTLQPDEIGARIDIDRTVDKVLAHSGDARRWPWAGSPEGSEVSTVVAEDDAVRDRTIAKLVSAAARKETHGDLVYRNGELTTTAPTDGQIADKDDVLDALKDATETLPFPSELDVAVTSQPAHVTKQQLEEVASQARLLLQPGLTVAAGTRSARIDPGHLGPLLTLEDDSKLDDNLVGLALREGAEELVGDLADALSIAAVEPRISAPVPTELLDSKGNATWKPMAATTSLLAGGKPGQVVLASSVRGELDRLVRNPRAGARLTLTPTPASPKSTDAQARAINSALGTFTTRYQCCQARVTNIRRIAQTIDGTLIGPGQQFSLNGIVGPRTRAKGYVEAPFILEGELSTDIGGGVSQFATTTLNAAFFAGLRLDRHQAHSFYISRYPAGREATVNYPGIDLVWTNDTKAAVLVRTKSTGTSVTVTLYGDNDRRTVTGTTAPRRAVEGRDFRVTVFRTIEKPGQPTRRDDFTTTYNRPPEEH